MSASELPPSPPPPPGRTIEETEATKPAVIAPRGTRVIESQVLFDGHAEVRIEHKGASYRLRQTALGKLILTK